MYWDGHHKTENYNQSTAKTKGRRKRLLYERGHKQWRPNLHYGRVMVGRYVIMKGCKLYVHDTQTFIQVTQDSKV